MRQHVRAEERGGVWYATQNEPKPAHTQNTKRTQWIQAQEPQRGNRKRENTAMATFEYIVVPNDACDSVDLKFEEQGQRYQADSIELMMGTPPRPITIMG